MNVLLVVQVLMLAKTARKQGYIYVLNSPVIRSAKQCSKNKCYSQPYGAQNCTDILLQIDHSMLFFLL